MVPVEPSPPPRKEPVRRSRKHTEDPRHVQAVALLIGNAIKAARERRGLTQRDLAFLTEGSVSVMSQYERGERTPSAVTMMRIAQACEVVPSTFYTALDRYRLPPIKEVAGAEMPPRKKRVWKSKRVYGKR